MTVPHKRSYSTSTLEHYCHRHMTGAPKPVSTDTRPTSHIS